MPANTRPYSKALRITAMREVGGRRRVWQLRSVVVMMAEQQKAAGAKDLWAEVVLGRAGAQNPAGGPSNGICTDRRDEGGWPTSVGDMRHRRGVRPSDGRLLGMPPLKSLRLSPAGGKPHGRWGGGGEEPGAE